MRFIVYECTGPKVAEWLRSQGHEVFSIYEEARGSSDDDILNIAFNDNWILITNDKDFGEKVYRENRPHRGVIFLRLSDERANAKVKAVEQLLISYSDRIPDQFVVVSERQVRFGRR